MEELLPLGLFGAQYFRGQQGILITPVAGNQAYDAVVTAQGTALPFDKLEVTQAHEGEAQHLRMLALEREGHVSAVGSVSKRGTKATGIEVTVEGGAFHHGAVLQAELERIEAAIQRKGDIEYATGTVLVVAFQDAIAIHDEDDLIALREQAEGLRQHWAQFTLLALVGWSRRAFEVFERDSGAVPTDA